MSFDGSKRSDGHAHKLNPLDIAWDEEASFALHRRVDLKYSYAITLYSIVSHDVVQADSNANSYKRNFKNIISPIQGEPFAGCNTTSGALILPEVSRSFTRTASSEQPLHSSATAAASIVNCHHSFIVPGCSVCFVDPSLKNSESLKSGYPNISNDHLPHLHKRFYILSFHVVS